MSAYPNIDRCDPRTCISAKMLQASRITAQIFRKHLHPYGLTDSQLTVLFLLSGGTCRTQKELATITYLEKSTISRNINRLVQRGLLSKASFPQICLTEAGKTLLNAVIPAWEKAMEEAQDCFQTEGLQALDTILVHLTSNQAS